jgi:transposase
LTECGLLRGSFIPPPEIAAIRELTRYRKKLIGARTSELQRLAKVLEDSGVKIDSVASTLTTLSARDMIEALITGERDPVVLANLARGRMRSKIPDLTMACAGRFGAQHALMCTLHLEHIDHLADMIARLDARIDEASLPFARQVELLATIPGIGQRAAQVIISEIGVDMTRFPTAAHLASWAGLCPGNNESAANTAQEEPVKAARSCAKFSSSAPGRQDAPVPTLAHSSAGSTAASASKEAERRLSPPRTP